MVTQAKTTGTQEATRHHGTYQEDQVTRHGRRSQEDDTDETEDEFNDDKNQRLEGYDENEYDAEDRRNRREATMADGDNAAHEQRPQQKSRRGFAAMDKEKQRAIASKGGKASHGGGRKPSKNR